MSTQPPAKVLSPQHPAGLGSPRPALPAHWRRGLIPHPDPWKVMRSRKERMWPAPLTCPEGRMGTFHRAGRSGLRSTTMSETRFCAESWQQQPRWVTATHSAKGLPCAQPRPRPWAATGRTGMWLLYQLIWRHRWAIITQTDKQKNPVPQPLPSGRVNPAQASVTEQGRAVAWGTWGGRRNGSVGTLGSERENPLGFQVLLSPQLPARGLASTSSQVGRSHQV